jgi:hypothetical protein
MQPSLPLGLAPFLHKQFQFLPLHFASSRGRASIAVVSLGRLCHQPQDVILSLKSVPAYSRLSMGKLVEQIQVEHQQQ